MYPFDRQPLYARNDRFKLLFNASGLPRSTYFLVDLDGQRLEANEEAPAATLRREMYEFLVV